MSDWLTYNPTSGGSGTTQMSVTAGNNPSNSPRSQRVIVRDTSGRTASLMVSQAASGASVFISPTSFLVGGAGGLDNIKYININTDLPWNVVSAPDWMSFNELSGFTSTTISFICTANYTGVRTGTIVIRNQGGATATASVTQSSLNYVYLSPLSFYFPVSGGSDNINVTSNTYWTLSAPSWITLSQTSGNGNSYVSFSVASNSGGQDLNGEITGLTSDFSATTVVEQEGDFAPSGSVSTTGITVVDTGGTYSNGITSNVPWTAITSSNWISVNPTSGDSGYTSVSISVTQNNTGVIRVGYVDFRSIQDMSLLATITITQQPVGGGGGGTGGTNEYFTIVVSNYNTAVTPSNWYISAQFDYDSGESSVETIEYNKNNSGWVSRVKPRTDTTLDVVSVAPGDIIQFRARITKNIMLIPSDYNIAITISGNIMSLLYGSDFQNKRTISLRAAFRQLFVSFGEKVFSNGNFVLPATALTYACYNAMFEGCSNLTNAPDLPATSLGDWCYSSMFAGCTSLTSAPTLPATELKGWCYSGMFAGCTSLATAPSLPATTMKWACYSSMFNGCTSLTTPPSLPASTLDERCYQAMFSGCTNLRTAPSLPVTSLKEGCYSLMFAYCTSLTTAPELPASTLVFDCYNHMFADCTSLNYVKCLATDRDAKDCTFYWMRNVGPGGTFVKAAGSIWYTGVSSIPQGWMIIDDA